MILIESSVAVDCLRTKDARMHALFRSLPGCFCGVTRMEVLSGARDVRDRVRLTAFLNAQPIIPIDTASWDLSGNLQSQLLRVGLPVPFADTVIAGVAISYNLELWTRDRHFAVIQSIVPQLRLFQEPP